MPDNPCCGHALVAFMTCLFVVERSDRASKHEPQLAPIVSGSNMRRAPWISVAPCVRARFLLSSWNRERGCVSTGHQPRAVLRGFVVHKNVFDIFVFASRAGCHWLFVRFRRDRRIRPQSWMARCVTPILFPRVCVCLSSDNLGALLQGPWVPIQKKNGTAS